MFQVIGKRGYVPKRFVREYKKLKSNLTYEVPTEFFEKEVTINEKVKINDSNQPAGPKDYEKDDVELNKSSDLSQVKKNVDKQVDNNQNIKVEDSNQPETLPNSGKNDELNKTVDLPQASKDVENVTDKVDVEKNSKNEIVETEESEGSEEAENSVPENRSLDSPETEPVDSQPKEFLDEKKAEKFLDGVQNVIPSYQIIDGTTIPLAAEEVPIKPSYPTPAIEATVIPDEVPILSVHPNIPVTGRPLIASFLNVDSRIAEGQLKQDNNVLTENQSSETGSLEKSSPDQDEKKDSPVVEQNVNEKPVLNNDSKIESSQDQSIDGNIEFSEAIKPVEDSRTDISNQGTPITNDENSKLESSDNSVETFVDTNSSKKELSLSDEATVISANDDVKDKLDTDENIRGNLENLNESSNEDLSSEINESSDEVEDNENDKHISEVELRDEKAHQEATVSETSPPEIVQNKNELDGSISEQKFQDSREQTEHLSDEKVINDTKETDRPNSVGEADTISETEVTGSEKTVAQYDDKVILNDTITEEHNDNFTVHNVDDIGVNTVVEDDSQNNSALEETKENDYINDNLNLSSEEAFTEAYSNVEEERATISRNLLTFQDGTQFDDSQFHDS